MSWLHYCKPAAPIQAKLWDIFQQQNSILMLLQKAADSLTDGGDTITSTAPILAHLDSAITLLDDTEAEALLGLKADVLTFQLGRWRDSLSVKRGASSQCRPPCAEHYQ